jgi:transcriptional antiterminator RfaH
MHRAGGSLPSSGDCPGVAAVNWYCLHTKPKREAAVAEYCGTSLGLETYLPRLQQHRTIRRVRRLVTSPLFPRYLFCRLELGTHYRAVRYAPDSLDLVHLGSGPAAVPDTLIGALRTWAGAEGDLLRLPSPLRPGDSVEITDGPMRGLSAVILRAEDEKDRVAILLSALQSGIPATISRSQLRKV